ncbi:HlyD family efflux transporter periplasmic adaptor subunit [Candidatus Sumerlaeota bacterium]|nr:HlyD family efflux transporter periplasmic adaptor subunit [Candidatus Sumerlaeota bacterium]
MSKLLSVVTLLVVALCGCSPADKPLTGYVEGEYVYVGPTTCGVLESIAVVDGSQTHAGDVLFHLDTARLKADLGAAEAGVRKARATLADLEKGKRPEEVDVIKRKLDDAQARLDNAKIEYERAAKLIETNTVSQSSVDALKMQYLSAQASVSQVKGELAVASLGGREDLLRAAKDDIEIQEQRTSQARELLREACPRAVSDAYVERVMYRVGEYVPAGAAVVMLLPRENRKIRFFVSQEQLPRIRLGQTVTASADGVEKAFRARVSYISSEAEFTPPVIYSVESRSKLVFMVEARPETFDEALRPGLPLSLRLD